MTSDGWKAVVDVAQSIVAVFSVLVALWALRAAFRFRSELSTAEQMANVTDLYMNEYADRKFSPPLTVNGKEVLSLKEARNLVRSEVQPKWGESPMETIKRFLDATLQEGNWENRFAYEVSLALERLGAAVFAGAIPLEFVLAQSADQIVEDWNYCAGLVKERIRARQDTLMPQENDAKGVVYFHRRHGEWLVYVSAIWLSQRWEGGNLKNLLARMSLEEVKERERMLREIDSELMLASTEKKLTRIIG